MSEKVGYQIDWSIIYYIKYATLFLAGFAFIIGWFRLTVFLMGLAG
jgi:hypothetical protein